VPPCAAHFSCCGRVPWTFDKAMSGLFPLLQWPAMVITLVAAWLVASQAKRKRSWGFWCFLLSNVLWIVWGWHDHAYALITLQVGLFALNVRGAWKNEPQSH
jgi:TctA family transporter